MMVPGCTAEQKALPTLLSLTQKNDMDFPSLCCIHKGKESAKGQVGVLDEPKLPIYAASSAGTLAEDWFCAVSSPLNVEFQPSSPALGLGGRPETSTTKHHPVNYLLRCCRVLPSSATGVPW